MNRVIKFVVESIEYLFYLMGRQVVVADRAEDGQQKNRPYLVRTIIAQNDWFCIYIHRFLCSDLETYHDHPWNFYTYVVSGRYTEYVLNPTNKDNLDNNTKVAQFNNSPKRNVRTAGSLAYRGIFDIHRVVVDEDLPLWRIKDAPLTMCFIGPRKRTWGFWPVLTSETSGTSNRLFIPWKDFLKLSDEQETHYIKTQDWNGGQ